MKVIILLAFAAAAILGILIAIPIFKKNQTSKKIVIAHGFFGALGVGLLAIFAVSNPHELLYTSLVLFVVVVLGGFILLANDLRGKAGPAPLVVVHALVAVVGLALVLLAFL